MSKPIPAEPSPEFNALPTSPETHLLLVCRTKVEIIPGRAYTYSILKRNKGKKPGEKPPGPERN